MNDAPTATLTWERPKRQGAFWRAEDDIKLTEMVNAGRSNRVIAGHLQRSLAAIKQRINFLGIARPERYQHPRREADKTCEDCSTQRGSELLARRLELHWHGEGHFQVKCWSEKRVENENNPVWGIGSNLVNGVPPT